MYQLPDKFRTLSTPFILCSAMFGLTLLPSGFALAGCPPDEDVAVRAAGYLHNQPLDNYADEMSLDDAYCAQAKYVAAIKKDYGEMIGYKVGGSSPD